MALIAALMAAFILLALVSTLYLLATSSTRRANYARKATIALHLAEAGIADALYRLNYCTGANFPFDSSRTPFNPTPLVGSPATTYSGSLEGGTYEVKWDSGTKRIISTGIYKGIQRKLSVQIRGGTDSTEDRQYEKQGIPEAFNKHVIYATTISGDTSALTGNIAYNSWVGSSSPSGNCTKTQIPSGLSGVCKADTDISFPSSSPSYERYLHNGYGYLTTYIGDGTDNDTQFYCPGQPNDGDDGYPVTGISYTSASDEYTFSDTALDLSYYAQDAGGGGNIKFDSATKIQKQMSAAGNITILDDGTESDTDLVFSGNDAALILNPTKTLTLGGATNTTNIDGDFVILGENIIFDDAKVLRPVKVKGTLCSDHNITLNTTQNFEIDASSSSREAAIIGYSEVGDVTIIIDNCSPIINLGPAQRRAIIAYSSGGNANVKMAMTGGNPVDLTTGNDWGSKAAIVAYSKTGNANVILGDNAGVNHYVKINGAIYSFGDDGVGNFGNITVDNASTEINGALVANGTVTLNGGKINWDSRPFVDATDTDTQIYQGFYGGRRVYLPVLGSWRQE